MPETNQKPTFRQVVNHPVTYALIVVVTVFNILFYWIIDFNKDSRETERKLNEKIIETQDRLYNKMIEEIRPTIKKVDDAAEKVDSAAVKVGEVAQKQIELNPKKK